jgi:hypothetical protein
MKVPVPELAHLLGVRDVAYVPGRQPLAVVDSRLG